MNKQAILLPIVAVLAVACNSATKDADAAKPPSDTSSASSSASSAGQATSQPAEPAKTESPAATPAVTPATAPPKKGPDKDEAAVGAAAVLVPPELSHLGYEYDGLANTKPIDMQIDVKETGQILTGSQTVAFKGVKDGKATFDIERTGGLSALGSEVASVEKDGVFTLSSTIAKLSPHAMELPAAPKPGMTWHFHIFSDKTDSKIDMETTCKVVGFEPVTTKVGTYPDALLVSQTGKGTLQGQKVRTESKNWYVKGLGTVKAVLKTNLPNGKSETLTLQETKH
ncbi:MAG: hypothetical protein P4L46_05695 [Fimbriimonas sp.]|nr:hypothetical protein [Fimbriimonas sp.]